MILVDVNLLLYAHIGAFQQHERARSWLDGQLNGRAPVGLPWAALLGFLRVATNPRIFERPAPLDEAWQQVGDWLDSPVAWIPQPTDRHRHVLDRLIGSYDIRGDLVPDAHLAALAIEHGLMLCSTDGDFAHFEGLRWRNPLTDPAPS